MPCVNPHEEPRPNPVELVWTEEDQAKDSAENVQQGETKGQGKGNMKVNKKGETDLPDLNSLFPKEKFTWKVYQSLRIPLTTSKYVIPYFIKRMLAILYVSST